jgi:hypothetical protein
MFKRNSGGGRPAEEGLRRELFYHKDTEGTQFTEKLKDFVLLTPATRASEEPIPGVNRDQKSRVGV